MFNNIYVHSYTRTVSQYMNNKSLGYVRLRLETDRGTLGLNAAYQPNATKIKIDAVTNIIDTILQTDSDYQIKVGGINCYCKHQVYTQTSVRSDGNSNSILGMQCATADTSLVRLALQRRKRQLHLTRHGLNVISCQKISQ